MSKGGSAPAAPDPAKVAALQGAEDRKTLQYGLDNSRTTTVNPFGSTSWKNNKTFDQAGFDAAMAAYKPATQGTAATRQWVTDGGFDGSGSWQDVAAGTPGDAGSGAMPNRADFEGKDNWVNTQTLSPESQGIYDDSTAKLKEAVGNIDTSGDAYNQKVADAIFARMRAYQDPLDAQARNNMQSNLADRGFQVGNEAFNTEMTRMEDSMNKAKTDGSNAAVIAGGQEARAQQAMQQQIAQSLQGLRGAQVAGVSGMPTTTTTPSIRAPDIAGMTYKNYEDQMNAYNAQQSGANSMFGSLLSLGGAALGSPWLGTALGSAFGGSSGGYNGGNTSSDFYRRRP